MTDMATPTSHRNLSWLRYVGWGGAAALVLMPLIAMQVAPNSGVNWTAGDFVFAAAMFGAVGLALELAVRSTTSWTYRAGAALALAAAFLLVWVNLAVGYIGSEDNPYNLAFFGVIAVAAAGALLARFRAAGMALAMTAAAIVHAVAGAIGYPADPVTVPATIGFTALWIASAYAFYRAARQATTVATD